MTESEWLTCDDPTQMLRTASQVRTERKIRLLLTHGARFIWDKLSLPVLREAVEIAERYVEGEVSAESLADAKRRTFGIFLSNAAPEEGQWWRDNVRTEEGSAYFVVVAATSNARSMSELERMNSWHGAARGLREYLPGLFRELFGPLPFHAIAFSDSWRTSTALSLARQMYENRDFGAMPILADALQDAGCEDERILNHCRDANQVHMRGCWVVDLVLGKE